MKRKEKLISIRKKEDNTLREEDELCLMYMQAIDAKLTILGNI